MYAFGFTQGVRLLLHFGVAWLSFWSLGHMNRVSSFSPLSLVLIFLSVACFCLSYFFEAQYAQTYDAHLGRPVIGLARPETYKTRDEIVLLADILVCMLAVVLALSRKHWAHWLAVVCTVIIGGAILLNVAARL